MAIYVVKPGDSVDTISVNSGIPVGELIWANQLEYPYRLAVGQALYLPGPVKEEEGGPPLYSFGYA